MHWALKDNAISRYYRLRRYMRQQGRTFEDWLDRLIVMGVIEVEDWERENGKFFGFPICCVEWFVWLRQMGIEAPTAYMARFYGYDDPDEYEYCRCPMCRTKRGSHE